MKSIIYYVWFTLLLGTFTALCGGGELMAFVLCYCFWGCMLAPMLPGETA
mgnify:FL=1